MCLGEETEGSCTWAREVSAAGGLCLAWVKLWWGRSLDLKWSKDDDAGKGRCLAVPLLPRVKSHFEQQQRVGVHTTS